MRTFLVALLVFFLAPLAEAQLARGFVENRGQWPDEVLYLAQFDGHDLWLTRDALVYDFYETETLPEAHGEPNLRLGSLGVGDDTRSARRRRGEVTEVRFEGRTSSIIRPVGTNLTTLNFFLGNDPSEHASRVPVHATVTLEGVAEHVDLILSVSGSTLDVLFEAQDVDALEGLQMSGAAWSDTGRFEVRTSLGARALGRLGVVTGAAARQSAVLFGGRISVVMGCS